MVDLLLADGKGDDGVSSGIPIQRRILGRAGRLSEGEAVGNTVSARSAAENDLLSLKGEKTSCPICADNFVKVVEQYGLNAGEKASVFHGAEGADKLTKAGILLRHWTEGQLLKYLQKGAIGAQGAKTWLAENNVPSASKFRLESGKGWGVLQYGRKHWGANWPSDMEMS